MCYWFGGSGIWMAVGGAFMLGLWACVIGLGAWGVWRLARRRDGEHEALATVSQRYARGEISCEEYARIRKDLS